MAESKPHQSPDKNVKASNVFERGKEEIEAILHNEKHSHHHHKETHGLRDDIDENTFIDDVRAPNVFERAKEEIEAIVQVIHQKNEPKHYSGSPSNSDAHIKADKPDSKPESDLDEPNLIERAKEEVEALIHKDNSPDHHYRETHGMRDNIDEKTPISEIKAPNLFERAKEEYEALVETVHPKKESGVTSPKTQGTCGLRATIGKWLQKICSPHDHNKDP